MSYALTRFIAGQGHDWPDFQILEHNGFTTLGTSNYDIIIELLKAGRIDYFPRAAHEAVVEAKSLNDPDIIIEPSVLLYYPSYMFFFVSQSKPELAQRIERGLNIARKTEASPRYLKSTHSQILKKRRAFRENRTQT